MVYFTFPQLNVGPEAATGEESWDEEDYILEDQQYRDTTVEEEEEQIEVEFPVKLEPKDQRYLEDTKAIKHKTRCKVCHEEFKNKKSEIISFLLFLQSLVLQACWSTRRRAATTTSSPASSAARSSARRSR